MNLKQTRFIEKLIVAFGSLFFLSLLFVMPAFAEYGARHFLQYQLPRQAVLHAFQFLEKRRGYVGNQNYIGIADFTKPSNQRRFYLLHLQTGEVESFMVAHGSGSGASYVQSVSDRPGSHMSAEGIYLTGEIYRSNNPGIRMRLDGVSATNQNARDRAIVIHGANYVDDSSGAGNSYGCFAFSWQTYEYIIDRLKGRAILLAYYDGSSEDQGGGSYQDNRYRDYRGGGDWHAEYDYSSGY
jgi:hypothetical protein